MSQSEDEFEEEEFLVYADFQSKIASEVLSDDGVNIQVIGFEEQNPIMQINNKLFQGTYEHSLGTHAFFSVDPDPPSRLDNYEHSPEVTYQLYATTQKVIAMDRMFIEPKDQLDDGKCNNDEPSPIPITKNYSMALNQFLKPEEEPPRNLDDDCDAFFKKYATTNLEDDSQSSCQSESIQD